MELVITIDAEEDQWGPVPAGAASVTNIQEVRTLQTLFREHRVVPTYLLTYPVAHDERAAALLRDLLDAGDCEIGMHCHPWNTPPHEELMNRRNSMLCNLPVSLQQEKIRRLHDIIYERFDRPPQAFRSGRWGFDRETAVILSKLGCRVDSSITPYTSWVGSEGPDFSSYSPHTFSFCAADFGRTDAEGDMVEVPVTIGYVGGTFTRCHRWRMRLNRPPFQRLRLAGCLAKLGFMRSVWLSPERETAPRLIRLLRQSMREGCRIVNLFFHTPSLQVGCTPFVRTGGDKRRLFATLGAVLKFCLDTGITPIPLSQAAGQVIATAAPNMQMQRSRMTSSFASHAS